MAESMDGQSTDPGTRIFLSSTSRDLAEHREVVKRECESRGYALTVMEEFGAQDDDASGASSRVHRSRWQAPSSSWRRAPESCPARSPFSTRSSTCVGG